jgi:hypothetical protein
MVNGFVSQDTKLSIKQNNTSYNIELLHRAVFENDLVNFRHIKVSVVLIFQCT